MQLSDPAEDVRYILQALFRHKYMGLGGKLPFASWSHTTSNNLRIDAQQCLFPDVPTTLAWQANWTAIEEEDVRQLVISSRKIGLVSTLPFTLDVICCPHHSSEDVSNG
ncbi:hypothetical protein FIBSPDRAFT_961149 [Athelia psychrophila]|uniref:Uncharacterized protein n=1 Tax=Athelia psychrophila TaxID=1759441 RepID=A0A166BJ85_9AGAM|nr:hypothetical protein FIBSPDRAFT_961149 [Fibularhizoctonia sp. CBS 109695]